MNGEPQGIVQRTLESLLGTQFTSGNRIDVLRNGDEIFPAMLEAIEAAQTRIEFLTFVYWKGDIAERFAAALAGRARAGIAVRVLLDAVGANAMPASLLKTMRDAGVDVQWFRPWKRWRVWHVDNRTHRKVLIVDGLVGFTGGVGIAAEWEGDARNEHEWRDTHFRIVGPAIEGLQGAFYGNWAETGKSIYDPAMRAPNPPQPGNARIQVIRTTAAIGWSDIASLIELLTSLAERRLRIASAYFVPDEDTIANLCRAAGRGVEIDVMMPGQFADHRVSQLAGEDGFRPLLDGGVRLWKYQRTMLHTKIMTIDGASACIGSANFNQRSMRKDDEVALVVLEADVVAALDRHFEEDLEQCERVDSKQWRNRGRLQRLKEAIVSPFKAQT